MRDIRRDVTNLSNQQKEVSPHGSLNVTTPRSNGPFNFSRTTEFYQPPHFDEELHPPPYGGKRSGFGGIGMPDTEEVFYWSVETTKSSIEVLHKGGDLGKVWNPIDNQMRIHIKMRLEESYRDLSEECLEKGKRVSLL
ncbi:hypothetical protein M9H77_17599 [Catharanthus roseus]|uniref:Uncharacterized protein n=1 Tax=Catharanthus roseus TaxID=4058 RepID=A0ACC0B539_CATRO|nr:hypothetical protein M9H77_17599 [Catharanthus roseus]